MSRFSDRFGDDQAELFRRLNDSLAFDRRLWPHDVAQSRAHATMLAAQGIISQADRDALLACGGSEVLQAQVIDDGLPRRGSRSLW